MLLMAPVLLQFVITSHAVHPQLSCLCADPAGGRPSYGGGGGYGAPQYPAAGGYGGAYGGFPQAQPQYGGYNPYAQPAYAQVCLGCCRLVCASTAGQLEQALQTLRGLSSVKLGLMVRVTLDLHEHVCENCASLEALDS